MSFDSGIGFVPNQTGNIVFSQDENPKYEYTSKELKIHFNLLVATVAGSVLSLLICLSTRDRDFTFFSLGLVVTSFITLTISSVALSCFGKPVKNSNGDSKILEMA